jgi:hypothetical protein
VSEIIFGWGQTNDAGVDIERYELTYRQNEYFQISGGRYHSAIGYYNTGYHHGRWFGTATGRPFMYYFEDSAGLLPVHNTGITATGLVPGTGGLNLHWVAEGGNSRSSSNAGQPVQNFLSYRNRKSFNVALYARPGWARGLQVGGSYYRDRLVPDGIPHVNQTIKSAYVVYTTPKWEFLSEAVLLTNIVDGQPFRTPLMYTQASRAFGKYRPCFRYQYVNSPADDPVNVYTDRYQGPSAGLRWDFSEFAAFKIQYNRLDQRGRVERARYAVWAYVLMRLPRLLSTMAVLATAAGLIYAGGSPGAVAIVVNKANSVETLTAKQLKQVFAGEKPRWPDGQKVSSSG